MPSLSQVFKAYDIRGIVPDELNALQFRAVGIAAARFTGADTFLVARDMRESGVELSAAFSLGVRSEGTTVIDLGLGSTDLLYYAAGSLDAPGCDVHRFPQPRPVQRAQTLPVGRPSDRSGHGVGRDPGDGGVAARGLGARRTDRTGPRHARDPRAPLGARCLRRPRPLLRRPRRAPAADGGRRHGQRDGGPGGPRGLRRPSLRRRDPLPELDGNFPNHPADPIQPENLVDLKRRCSSAAPTSAWPSTGMPTGSSWSTSRPSRSRVRSPPRWWPRPCSTSTPVPRCSTTASARGWCPRSSPRRAVWASAPRSGTASSSRSWPTPVRSSVASTPVTTTSGTTTGPTRGSSRPWSCSNC